MYLVRLRRWKTNEFVVSSIVAFYFLPWFRIVDFFLIWKREPRVVEQISREEGNKYISTVRVDGKTGEIKSKAKNKRN